MIYGTFAQLYDELFDQDQYDNWFEYTKHTVSQTGLNWLELACGAGQLAIKLLQDGQQVVGFDLSEEMLSLANQHAQEAQVELPLIQGNMLDLSELPKYQVISCYADSLCYLADKSEVTRVFSEVFNHLEPNGQFIFDVITPYQVNEVYPGYMFNYQDDQKAFLWSSFSTDEENTVEHDLSFFIKNKKDSYQKVTELHREKTYSLDEYRAMLTQVGFGEIEVRADFGKKMPNETSTRWFFSCRRTA